MMKLRSNFLQLSVASLLLVACGGSRNLGGTVQPDAVIGLSQQNVNATLYQNTSAEVAWLQEQGYRHARLKLDANISAGLPLPPAVILDVDETVLDNSPYELENLALGRSYSPETWKQWTARASAKPIPGALTFVQYAVANGCSIFYITNRDADEKGVTITNLAALGFPMADSTHVLTMQGSSNKTERRDGVKREHSVVLMIGDQLTDYDQRLKDRSTNSGLATMYTMAEELAQYFVLLPNSTYGYWRDEITGKGSDGEKLERVKGYLQKRGK